MTSVTLQVTEKGDQLFLLTCRHPPGHFHHGFIGHTNGDRRQYNVRLAQSGTGLYADNLCFVDFSSLTGAQLAAAQSYTAPTSNSLGVCGIEMAAAIPGGFTMYFCLGLVGGTVAPYAMPSYVEAAMGNSLSGGTYTGVPFYLGIPGSPALYQTTEGQNP